MKKFQKLYTFEFNSRHESQMTKHKKDQRERTKKKKGRCGEIRGKKMKILCPTIPITELITIITEFFRLKHYSTLIFDKCQCDPGDYEKT